MFRERRSGMRQLEMLIEQGMEACAEVVAERGRANLAPYRDTGAAEDSIHLNTEHLSEWPEPVVFVSTASGDGFFIHEGTVDTPYRPFFSMAVDQTARDFPRIMRATSERSLGRSLDILNREFSADQRIRRI